MKEKILSSLLTVLAFSVMQAQDGTIPVAPRLVVGITIDQLRADYLATFASLYGERGFKRLWREGRVYSNAAYGFSNVDGASAMASLYTGTSPAKNGIVAARWLDRSSLRSVSCSDDRDFMGYYTAEHTSPKNLLVSTVTDELKIATQGRSIVYAFAPSRDEAVMAAGHAADGAYWLNELTGKWGGSTYYGTFPRWLMVYNDNQSTDSRIGNIQWELLLDKSVYDNPTGEAVFSHTFSDARKYRRLKKTPCVNDEVNKVVNACLYGTMIGADPITDFLSVTYQAGSFHSETGVESYLEMQDTYARLDKDLAALFDMVDKKVGLENTLFFLTSTGYVEGGVADHSAYHIPTGEFYINRATALLNMYLMALYGDGQYVEVSDGLQIYLDRKLIEKKQLILKDVLDRSAEFLTDLSGVQQVYTAYDLSRGGWSPELERVRNGYNPQRSGDICLEICAGWKLMDADSREINTVRQAYVSFPLIFMGAGIVPETVHTVVATDCIAPTLSSVMRIRAPNACSSAPITDLFK
ncbi:MAG: alkaline phosphatase family protein [Bacteroidaceae bacterium]|nr:alkaline phosphatase family protein [Bacteroidaceae bacterium]